LNIGEIAERLHRSESGISNRRNKINAVLKGRIPDTMPRRVAEWLAKHPNEGDTAGSIALGITRTSFYRIRQRLGIAGRTHAEANRASAEKIKKTLKKRRLESAVEGLPLRMLDALKNGPILTREMGDVLGIDPSHAPHVFYKSLRPRGLAFIEGKQGKKGGWYASTAWWAEKHYSWLVTLAKRIAPMYSVEPYDLVSAAIVNALPQAAKRMRATGVKFTTFATPIIRLEMLKAGKSDQRKGVYVSKNYVFKEVGPKTGNIYEGLDKEEKRDEAPPIQEDFWVRAIEAVTDARAKYAILKHFRDGMRQDHLAEELNLSQAWVSQLITAGLKEIRESGVLIDYGPNI